MVITRELTNMASASTASDIQLGSCATSIGDGAFSGYTNIIELELPEYVSSIGVDAFKNCSNIDRIDVGATTPPSLGLGAFDNTNNAPIYVLETSYDDYISAEVWSNYSSRIMYEEMPYKVKLINNETFRKILCDDTFTITNSEVRNAEISPINRVLFGDCLTEIGVGAFSGTNIETTFVPSGVTTINSNAFSNCTNLSGITLNNGLEAIGNSAFTQCSSMSYIELPQTLSTLGASAFEGCTSIRSISIPQLITTVSDNLFKGCTSLSSITIPSNVTSIGNASLSGCINLKNIDMPSNVTTIGNSAFTYCESLEQPIILDNVYSIGNKSFYGCVNLKRLYTNRTIPPSLGSSQSQAFDNSWFPIVVPQNSYDLYIQSEGWSNYADRIMFDGGFKMIAKCKVGNNDIFGKIIKCLDGSGTTLTSEEIQSTFRSIHGYVREAEIGGCINTIASDVFKDSGAYSSYGVNRYISALTIDDGVTDIQASAFDYCYNLEKVKLPSGLTVINDNVLSNCYSLTSVTIPNSVTSIGQSAFGNCSSLTSITIPSGVTSIGRSAFWNCTSFSSITIPSSVTSIGRYAFDTVKTATFTSPYPPTIDEYVFGSNVILYVPCAYYDAYIQAWSSYNYRIEPYGEYTKQEVISGEYICEYDNKKYQKIGNYVSSDNINWCLTGFYSKGQEISDSSNDCATRLHLEYNSNCTECENNGYELNDNGYVYTDFCNDYSSTTIAYSDIPSGTSYYITSATFGDCVTSVENASVFSSMTNIVSCNILSIASIPDYSFSGKTSLTSCTLGSGVTSIGAYAFQYCRSLTSIDMPSGVTSIGDFAFYSATSLTSIDIPNSVTSIGMGAFSHCRSLSSCTIGSGVTIIPTSMFDGCSGLTSIDIPSGVTSIGDYAFCDCSGLTSITVKANTPPYLYDCAIDSNSNYPIFVPSQSVETYKAASGWSDYANRIQAIPNS